jgi:hypothetical protein
MESKFIKVTEKKPKKKKLMRSAKQLNNYIIKRPKEGQRLKEGAKGLKKKSLDKHSKRKTEKKA